MIRFKDIDDTKYEKIGFGKRLRFFQFFFRFSEEISRGTLTGGLNIFSHDGIRLTF